MLRLPLPPQACQVCGKIATTGFYRSHSHHRVKRLFRPNLIKNRGRLICVQCLRTERKYQKTSH